MRAVVQARYGPPSQLRVAQVPKPVAGPGQVLVKVLATSMNVDIWHVVTGRPILLVRLLGAGVRKPKTGRNIPGTDCGGVVEAVGRGVTRFKVGDVVYGDVVGNMQWKFGGSYAEYVAVKEDDLALKPERATLDECVSSITSGVIALSCMVESGLEDRRPAGATGTSAGASAGAGSEGEAVGAAHAKAGSSDSADSKAAPTAVQVPTQGSGESKGADATAAGGAAPAEEAAPEPPQQHVLVNGAAGSVGSVAIQIARAFGARVTAVDRTDRLDALRRLGAHSVIDFTTHDASDPATNSGPPYDLILDVASTMGVARAKKVLAPTGKYNMVGHDNYGNHPGVGRWIGSISNMMKESMRGGAYTGTVAKRPTQEAAISTLRTLLADGSIKPVIDKQSFTLDTVAEAMAYMQSDTWAGRIVVHPNAGAAEAGPGAVAPSTDVDVPARDGALARAAGSGDARGGFTGNGDDVGAAAAAGLPAVTGTGPGSGGAEEKQEE